ncbi:MAG: hypothetical protein PHY28_10055 [Dehalococcoidales bacterium]|nr:hypothetical protein [Dehalococcoidales bacterium]
MTNTKVEKRQELFLEETSSNLSRAERDLLYDLAKRVPSEQTIVELARNPSESTLALVGGAAIGNAGVFNLDLDGSGSNNETDDRDDGILDVEIPCGVTVFKSGIYELIRYWNKTIGLLAVIGYQQSEDVREAITCWQGHLSPDVAIAVYDYNEPGPAKAIRELLTDCGNFILKQVVDNMAIIVMDKCQHYWIINSIQMGVCKNCGRKRNFRRLVREAANLGFKKRTATIEAKPLKAKFVYSIK